MPMGATDAFVRNSRAQQSEANLLLFHSQPEFLNLR